MFSRKFVQSALAAALAAALLPAAQAAERGVAYVSNQNGGVNVVDLASGEIVRSIDPGGKSPRGIGITADGKFLVTANKDDANLSVIDTASGSVVRQIAIGKNPEFVRVAGNRVFVTYEPGAKSGPPPKPGTAPAAKDDDDDDKVPAHIAIVDLKRGKVIKQITSGPETEGIEFTPDGKRLVVTNEADNTITVHDIASGKLLKTVSTADYGMRPRGIKVAPDGSFYVATLEFSHKLLTLDRNFKPLRTADTGNTPYGVSFDRDGKRIFVATAREKALQVFDAKSLERIASIPTGDRCWHFSFTPDNAQILLACGKSDELLVIDAEKLEVTKRIPNPGTPWGVVTYPKALGSLDRP